MTALATAAGAPAADIAGRGLLRFLTCGSVDDGKSTLIGRLLYETQVVFDDHIDAVTRASRRHGTTGEDVDLALLVDGLEAEREQGITIDVAYRYFATARRKFIVADTPGHEQYTRNMATGASTADLAILLVDARKGVLIQTKRHAYIAKLLGIRHLVLAVNKIDLVGFDAGRFAEIEAEFRAFVAGWDFATAVAIPLSARFGDNLVAPSPRVPWYDGPTLLQHLETVEVDEDITAQPFRMAVQWVNRPNLDFRGLSGSVAGGRVRSGDPIVVTASGQATRVARIVTADGDIEEAEAGQAVTLTCAEEVDASRGDVLAPPDARPEFSDQFAAHLIWMHETPLFPGRPYLLKAGTRSVTATVSEIKHRVDVNSLSHLAAKELQLNEIGFCNLSLSAPIAFDPYSANRETGGFILIDRLTNATVGAGMIEFGLRRATNIHWQALDVDKAARARLKEQRPAILWFTGLSGAGKSTIANLVERKLLAEGRHTYLLDGDNVRHGLNRDLGFTETDRIENIRRVAETAKLFVDAGLLVLVSFISPFRAERQMARDLVEAGEFIEIFVDTTIDECRRRDPKGLYAKADRGQIKNFTGIDSPYEPPERPELRLDTVQQTPEASAEAIVRHLRDRGLLG
ncbi:adenylyl-sulfate kinase [Allostella sp. ATCC 35155]|nr:adenylyl-sulfate kinase [Stella sp. ATCC 35155]